jgi:aromatase
VSRHHVVIEPDAVERILGPTATIEDARSFVRDALGANSRATLGHAKGFIEGYERV